VLIPVEYNLAIYLDQQLKKLVHYCFGNCTIHDLHINLLLLYVHEFHEKVKVIKYLEKNINGSISITMDISLKNLTQSFDERFEKTKVFQKLTYD
jgi:hypothetical protein